MTVDFGELFKLEEEFVDDAVRADEVRGVVGRRDIELATGHWTPRSRIRFEQYTGTKLCDLMGTQLAALKLISNRVFEAFRGAGLRGWDTLPVDLRDAKGVAIDGYELLVIKARCGPVDNTRSIRVDTMVAGRPRATFPGWKGLYFDESTWDGSDVFGPVGTAFVLATRRVKDVLERIGATNFHVTSLGAFERTSLI